MRDIFLFFILPLSLVTAYQHCRTEAVDTVERVYDTRFGAVYCGRREPTACGYRLSACSDAQVYLCVTDLKYEDK